MFLKRGLFMCCVFIILGFFIFIFRHRKSKPKKVFLQTFLYVLGSYYIFAWAYLPFPLNKKGLFFLGDRLLPFNETLSLIPFYTLFQSIDKLNWFLEIFSLLTGGFFIGTALSKTMVKRTCIWAISFIIPAVILLSHIIIRLLTGVMLLYVDVTYILLFMVVVWLGYFVGKGTAKFWQLLETEKSIEKI